MFPNFYRNFLFFLYVYLIIQNWIFFFLQRALDLLIFLVEWTYSPQWLGVNGQEACKRPSISFLRVPHCLVCLLFINIYWFNIYPYHIFYITQRLRPSIFAICTGDIISKNVLLLSFLRCSIILQFKYLTFWCHLIPLKFLLLPNPQYYIHMPQYWLYVESIHTVVLI